MSDTCKYHVDHENRLTKMETKMDKLEILLNNLSPRLWVAGLALIGTIFSTIGTIVGVLIVAYFKANGGIM